MSARNANYKNYGNPDSSVRVICPDCGSGGSHPLSWSQPLCHLCDYKVLMCPASNSEIECTWEEAKEFNNARYRK